MRDHFDLSGVFETIEFEIAQVACISLLGIKPNNKSADITLLGLKPNKEECRYHSTGNKTKPEDQWSCKRSPESAAYTKKHV